MLLTVLEYQIKIENNRITKIETRRKYHDLPKLAKPISSFQNWTNFL